MNRLQSPLCFLCPLLLVALGSQTAANTNETVTVTMTAPSELEAIRFALAEAVGRVNGVELQVGGHLHPNVAEAMQRLEVDFTPGRNDHAQLRAVSSGYVRNYAVLNTTKGESGITVELEANVLTFDPDNPRPGTRQTVTVEGFELVSGALRLDQPAVGGEDLQASLRDDLEAKLVRSGKFSVLTRKNLKGVQRGDNIALEDHIKLHQMLGSDFLVSGRIDQVYVHTETETVKLTGHQSHTKTANVHMTVTLYEVATGRIRWSRAYARNYEWDDATLLADPSFKDDGLVARTMVIEGADALAVLLVREVFAVRVMGIDLHPEEVRGPVLFLNVGKAVYDKGQEFELILKGKALADPETKEILGYRERVLGRMHLFEQNDKFSRAQVHTILAPDDLALISADDFDLGLLICRAL